MKVKSKANNMTSPINPKADKRRFTGIQTQTLILKSVTTFILAAGAAIIMIPFLYLLSTSVKDRDQLRQSPPPLVPIAADTVNINGQDEPLYHVTVDGQARDMALIKFRPGGKALFVDPTAPEQTYELVVADQTPIKHVEIHFENYPEALKQMKFNKLLINTLLVTFLGMAGMLFSCSLVAYGFSRFRAPWLNVLFILLLSTIMLPSHESKAPPTAIV
jgi:ABC-type glycerol-3-phosphate transport system permease component